LRFCATENAFDAVNVRIGKSADESGRMLADVRTKARAAKLIVRFNIIIKFPLFYRM
jgi:hypothetical protein